MDKHDRQKRKEFIKRRKQDQLAKTIRKTRQQTKDAINGPTNNDNDTSIAKVRTQTCSVKVHADQDKACDISDNTSISQHESEAGSDSVQKSNTRSPSPFHIPSTYAALAEVNLQNNLLNLVHGKELRQHTSF